MDLVNTLVGALGVNADQAKGGAGMLMGLAKSQLNKEEFSTVAGAVPGIDDLISTAPSQESSGGSMLSGAMGAVTSALGGGNAGGLASLAGGLSKLDLNVETIVKFVPVIISFVKSKGNADAGSLLERVLK